MADEQPPATSTVEDKPTTEAAAAEETTNTSEAQDSAPAAQATEESTTNGEKSDIPIEDVATAGPQATTQVNAPDGEEKAAADPVAAADDATKPADAAPSGKSKRKSSGAVPEHKQKKTIGKRKSMVNLNLDVQPGDHYWARLKGYPPWPAVICDESMLPEVLLASRPVSTMRPDGTYREDFQDGGKNVKDRTYPIMFLATNEFAWMINTSLTKLNSEECTVDENNKKLTKDLKSAYKIAQEDHDLDFYKNMLSEHEEEMKSFAAEQARLEAEAAAKEQEKADKAAKKAEKEPAKKKSRKSKGGDDDEMDVDESEEKPASKKRKKEAESEGEGAKPKKTPKVKLAANKDAGTPAKKSKKPAAKSTESESAEPQTEAQKFEARKLKVLHLRHRLQKGFVSREGLPKDDEMPQMNDYFNTVETSPDIDAAIIRDTKIHKVLKAILKMETIPRDDEFHFKDRSQALLASWNALLEGPETKVPATNGEVEGNKKDIEKDEEKKDDETPAEPAAAPVEATEPGNAAVDEADVKMDDAISGADKEDKPAEAAADVVKDAAEEAKQDEETEAAAAPAEAETAEA